MRGKIIYYSETGHTRSAALLIQQTLGCPLRSVRTLPSINDCSVIIIGSPVRDEHIHPAMRSYIGTQIWKGKTVYPFITCGGVFLPVFQEIRAVIRGARITDDLVIRYGFKGNLLTSPKDITAWAERIKLRHGTL